MKCDIIIAVWNNRELTHDCIESIVRNTQFPYRLVIIDNGSEPETRDYLAHLQDDNRFSMILIRNETNRGGTIAINQGLRASNAEFVCNMDNDTLTTAGWLSEMVAIAQSAKDIGIVIPSGTVRCKPRSYRPTDLEACARECRKTKGTYLELGTADCYCALIKREVINTIGLWNEAFNPGYFDDDDFSLRAVDAGYKIVVARGAYVCHREHGSFQRKNTEKERLFKRNQELFNSIHGKRERILCMVNRSGEQDRARIEAAIYAMAKRAHWVWVYEKAHAKLLALPVHAYIKRFTVPAFYFWPYAIARVLLRRKKKFDRLYVPTTQLKKMLERLKVFHSAQVELLHNIPTQL